LKNENEYQDGRYQSQPLWYRRIAFAANESYCTSPLNPHEGGMLEVTCDSTRRRVTIEIIATQSRAD
jgi:hypothetical protein